MMIKTKIEWCDATVNPVKGLCPVDCKDNQGKSYCYARRMYKRFKWNPEIRFDVDNAYETDLKTPSGSRIFVGSTIELFGDWVKTEWMESIFQMVNICKDKTFIFLTKKSENLIKWSPFPDNCWVGVSVTNQIQYDNALKYLKQIDATVKFLSIEPLLEHIKVE